MAPDRVDNPDDAMLMPDGDVLSSDIKNCRVLIIRPPAHRPLKIIGHSSNVCLHDPPRTVRQSERGVPADRRPVPGH